MTKVLNDTDTIVAMATPPGHAGVAIVRISGAAVPQYLKALLGQTVTARHALLCDFLDRQQRPIDSGIALYFPAPHSFTGEHVLELQGHGGPVVMDMLIRRVLELGARLAQAGEFSQRAFLNDKLDLAQAEAIADLINAGSEQAVRAAQKSLQGEFSVAVSQIVQEVIKLRMYVEASIDFPEEDIDFLSDGKVLADITQLHATVEHLMANAQQGCLLQEGMRVVLVGQPNTGKSSLLNALAGRDSAIVTPIAGTTRDVLREAINLHGLPLHLIDTAGLRDSEDVIEQEGIRRTWQEIEQADAVLLLMDAQQGMVDADLQLVAQFPASVRLTYVYNKIDLVDKQAEICCDNEQYSLYISAKSGNGIDLLEQHLSQCMHYTPSADGQFMARRRHLDALQRAQDAIEHGRQQLQLNHAGELLAEDLRHAQHALNAITGEFSNDDLLGEIFSGFCIGK